MLMKVLISFGTPSANCTLNLPFKTIYLKKNVHKLDSFMINDVHKLDSFMINGLLVLRTNKSKLYKLSLIDPTAENISSYRTCNSTLRLSKKLSTSQLTLKQILKTLEGPGSSQGSYSKY
jgi:hypothetical protein